MTFTLPENTVLAKPPKLIEILLSWYYEVKHIESNLCCRLHFRLDGLYKDVCMTACDSPCQPGAWFAMLVVGKGLKRL